MGVVFRLKSCCFTLKSQEKGFQGGFERTDKSSMVDRNRELVPGITQRVGVEREIVR